MVKASKSAMKQSPAAGWKFFPNDCNRATARWCWRPAMRFERMTCRVGTGRSSAELRGQFSDAIYLTCMCFPYICENMQDIRKTVRLLDVGDDARRQFIDAQAVFQALEEATKAVAEVRGGMYWKRQGPTEYLIRTSPRNAQKSLGPRSAETEAIHSRFTIRKEQAEARKAALKKNSSAISA